MSEPNSSPPTEVLFYHLEQQTLVCSPDLHARFAIDAFARRNLMDGVDELGFLLREEGAIARHEKRIVHHAERNSWMR